MPNAIVPEDENELAPFAAGVEQANAEALGEDEQAQVARIREEAMVKSWFERISTAREHDKEAYKQLAIDRMYARGDSIFETKVNIIGSYIDTWTSLLYAKNPDIDAVPSECVGESGMEEARLFGKTSAIVVSKLWKKGRLKIHAKPWTRAALTSCIAWVKVTWQEREGSDPTTDRAISDLQDNLASVHRQVQELREGGHDCGPAELQAERLRLALLGLEQQKEVVKRKGLCIDPVDMADITVSDEAPSAARYLDSPWISHRTYMRVEQAKAMFPALTKDEIKSCATFSQKPPKPAIQPQSGALQSVSQYDADAYQAYQAVSQSGKGGFVCVEEVWDRDTNQVITLIHGLKRYARAPFPPNPGTTRFYPFFGLMFTEVDGQRWPQSLNQRSQSLQDAFSRTFHALEEHRKRIKPKLGFNAAMLDDAMVTKLTTALTQELVPIQTTNPKADIRSLITPIVYAAIDMAVYDTSGLMKQFELIWGLQEAMTASIDTAKTATEAELQQSGTNARTADKRDRFEEELTDLAEYTQEIALQKLTHEDVIKLAGPEAFWPVGATGEPMDIEEIDQLATLNIRAGSSGKPNSRQMREAWAAIMPLLQALMEKIAMLRMSDPLDLADKLEELVVETASRSGEALDPSRFIPQVGQPMMLIDPVSGMPVQAYPGGIQPGQDPNAAPGAVPAPGGPSASPGLGDTEESPALPMPTEG